MNARSVVVLAALALAPAVVSAQSADTWRAQAVASFDEVWQTVADTFYDPSFAGLQWPDVRQEFRPRVEAAASPDDARGVIREMLARLRRSHFVLLSESDAARRTETPRPVEAGDIIQLGNLPPLAVRTDVRELHTAAGRPIGFIGFNFWMTAIDAPVAAAIDRFRDADGLILDLRGNAGGLAAMMSGIAGHVIGEPVLLGRMRTREFELEFRVNPRLTTADGRRVRPFGGRLAILVDERTASTSECFAGALQDLGRARVFGRPTRGEALPALTKRLPSGDVLLYAVGDFVTAAGRALEGDGVRPDEIVPAREGTPGRGDETLEAALRWLGSGPPGTTKVTKHTKVSGGYFPEILRAPRVLRGELGAPLALGAPLLLSSDDLQAR